MLFKSQPAPKFRYRLAVRKGPLIQTAGMVGISPDSNELVSGGAGAEFRQILNNLTALTQDNEITLDDLMSATIYTSAFHRFPEINLVWDKFFESSANLPARSAVGVSQLPIGAQVEADFLFYVPSRTKEGASA